jgi:hypothetical protein
VDGCEISDLLRTKNYAEFAQDYEEGLEKILLALGLS